MREAHESSSHQDEKGRSDKGKGAEHEGNCQQDDERVWERGTRQHRIGRKQGKSDWTKIASVGIGAAAYPFGNETREKESTQQIENKNRK